MTSKEKLIEATILALQGKLTETTQNTDFYEFLNDIKIQEINFYQDIVDKVYDYESKYRAISQPKDDSPEEQNKWSKFIQGLYNISDDSDVSDYRYIIITKGIEAQKQALENNIESHIQKLEKSVTKEIGNVLSMTGDNNVFTLNGEKGTCTLSVTPIKLSSTKKVIKTKFKISNIELNSHNEDKHSNIVEDNEYIKEWKQQELDGYIKALQVYKEKVADAKQVVEESEQTVKDLIEEYINKTGKQPEIVQGRYTDETLYKASQQIKLDKNKYFNIKNQNLFFRDYGYSSNFEEIAKNAIDKHFEQLQSKVENKIGRIIKIKSLGGDDYAFEGEKGNCVVEVIWAGGYNIQRLHTRWIVKNWNSKIN